MHQITNKTDCLQGQCAMLAAFIRDKSDVIVSQWSAISCVDACESDGKLFSQIQSEVKALLHAVAEYLHAGDARRNQPEYDAASLIVSAERYAIHYLTSGYTEVQLVLTLQALRKVALQLWTDSLVDYNRETLAALDRANQAFDNVLSSAVDHYCHIRNQCHGLFLKTLAHDLRNPLGGLELIAQVMMQNTSQAVEGIHKIASNISRSVDNAVKVTGDMYDLGNMRGGLGILVNPVMTDVAALCKKLVDGIASRYPEQSVSVEIGVPQMGMIDESRIMQALLNLIGYAGRHTNKQRPAVARLQASSTELAFSVRYLSDTPAADDIEALFIPMRRYATHLLARRGPLSELGLDLYIAREIIQAHEGELHVFADDGWMTFDVRLQLDGRPVQ